MKHIEKVWQAAAANRRLSWIVGVVIAVTACLMVATGHAAVMHVFRWVGAVAALLAICVLIRGRPTPQAKTDCDGPVDKAG